jgi:hypothetical protein
VATVPQDSASGVPQDVTVSIRMQERAWLWRQLNASGFGISAHYADTGAYIPSMSGGSPAGLRAGVPSIVVPFFGDQPFWGQRVADLGVGPEAIPRKRLTRERLAAALREAVTDGDMRQRAAVLGAQIRAEDGVGRAVAVFEEWYGEGN